VYDNLRSAVLERAGTAIRFHPRLLELAGHYHFAPRPCTPGRANEKGKVERQIHYLRHAFFAARTFVDVNDLNAQFRRWRDEVAHQRTHPEQRDRTVAQVLAEEQARLLPLAAHPFDTEVTPVARSPAARGAGGRAAAGAPRGARRIPPRPHRAPPRPARRLWPTGTHDRDRAGARARRPRRRRHCAPARNPPAAAGAEAADADGP